ncbi:hypothetical protein GCM10010339_43200 [Streptomyces alanosinicus]|uniref:Uncharacterized protein n=1 Tax=Streptomyces alanosinicus TaxID=68171 RepID=A0A919D400_9ACTN|nr:hypothetical protein GCM10010339_43200 [Streptomyces alanosinicus]
MGGATGVAVCCGARLSSRSGRAQPAVSEPDIDAASTAAVSAVLLVCALCLMPTAATPFVLSDCALIGSALALPERKRSCALSGPNGPER